MHPPRPRSPLARRTARTPLATVVLALAGLTGCNVAAAKDWNLDELHDEDGRHRFTAALMGDFEYLLRTGFVFLGTRVGEDDRRLKEPEAVDDPLEECLTNLVELTDFDPDDPTVAAWQVEWAARLATRDPWKLSRERAALELGRAGRRLGLTGLGEPPSDEEPVGPTELREILRSLLRAAEPALAGGGSSDESVALDVSAACEVLRQRRLDLDGALRSLRTVTVILDGRERRPGLAPVRELSMELQHRCVRLALSQALRDEAAVVRAAAVDGSLRAVGPRVFPALLGAVDPREDAIVLVRLMDWVARYGLPQPPPEVPADEGARARDRWMLSIWALTGHPEDRVRTAALRALGRADPTGPDSLRSEDWLAWHAALVERARPAGPSIPEPADGAADGAAEEGGS